MKKIIFTLLALVGTMSMNAQIVKLYKGDVLVTSYDASQVDNVVFEEAPAFSFGQGEAEATDIGNVKWIQLWKNGPKFAEYNVGAENNKPEDYGGYYAWGGSQDKVDDHNEGESNLTYTGDNITDTATKLWGSKWRMPTKEEFDNLLAKCTVVWIDGSTKKYNNTSAIGLLCTGKGDYENNSVFLPAAGVCISGDVYSQGILGDYYSSTPNGSRGAYGLYFVSSDQHVDDTNNFDRDYGYSVRAVLAE